MRLLALLLAVLCMHQDIGQSPQAAAVPSRLEPPSSRLTLGLPVQDLCANFKVICDFVAKNCNPKANNSETFPDENPKCVESFNLFYQHNSTLSSCIQESPADPAAKTQALVFLEFYSVWQKENACKLFHATEAKAANECSRQKAHRPWKQISWPLYCHEVFTMYNSTRNELDQLCSRTPNSEAFWEGYVDYIGSKTCKEYYDMVREARERGCGEEEKALHGAQCREMFQWYVTNKEVVETDCFEVRASKPFYRGFYTWKMRQH